MNRKIIKIKNFCASHHQESEDNPGRKFLNHASIKRDWYSE